MNIYFYQFADGTYLKGKLTTWNKEYCRTDNINKARVFKTKGAALMAGGDYTYPENNYKCKRVLREGDAIIAKEINI